MTRSAPHTTRGLDRLVNFSDATVAIAITLLVLPLVDLASNLDRRTLGELFAANIGSLLAFFITFAVIARLWMVHHRVFDWLVDYSQALVWWNVLWLASIVLLPFAAETLSYADGGDASVVVFYASTIAVTSVAMLAMLRIMRRRPELVREDMRGKVLITPSLAALLALLVVVAAAIIVPPIGAYALLLLFLTGPIGAILERMPRRTTPGTDRAV